MSEPRFQLSAIVYADIVGSAVWMDQDFDFATGLIRQARDIVAPTVEKHNGVLFRQFGDGFLLTFASAVDAVRFGLSVNSQLPTVDPPALRVGIDIGEVSIVDGDLQGVAANVAHRLQSMAPPRSVLISGNVWQLVRNQAEFECEFQSTEVLKNVRDPVDTYVVQSRGSGFRSRLLHYDIEKKIGEGGMGEQRS
jgi:adenylate cyclase